MTRPPSDVRTTAEPRHNSDVMMMSYCVSSRVVTGIDEARISTRTSMSSNCAGISLLDDVTTELPDTKMAVEESRSNVVALALAKNAETDDK